MLLVATFVRAFHRLECILVLLSPSFLDRLLAARCVQRCSSFYSSDHRIAIGMASHFILISISDVQHHPFHRGHSNGHRFHSETRTDDIRPGIETKKKIELISLMLSLSLSLSYLQQSLVSLSFLLMYKVIFYVSIELDPILSLLKNSHLSFEHIIFSFFNVYLCLSLCLIVVVVRRLLVSLVECDGLFLDCKFRLPVQSTRTDA
jgi:hypothetical protein